MTDRVNDLWPTPTAFESAKRIGLGLHRQEGDELPDLAPEDFASEAEYEQWLAEGAQRFFAL